MNTSLKAAHYPARVIAQLFLMLVFCLQMQAAPANDLASKAQVISGAQLQVSGTIVGATAENGEPSHSSYRPRRTVWYSWTAPITGAGRIILTPAPNVGRMHIGIYTGTPFTSLKYVLTDDILEGEKRTSLFDPVSGVRYLIAVDGDEPTWGAAFTLNLDVRSTVLTLVSPANLNNWFAPCTLDLEFKVESGKPVRSLQLYDGRTLLKSFSAPPFLFRLTNNLAVVRNIYAKAIDVDYVAYTSKTNTFEIRNPNEAFKDAIVIEPDMADGKWTIAGVNGSREPGEPLHNGRVRDALWWRWTPKAGRDCRLEVVGGSTFYSISVYTGSAVNDLKPVSGEALPKGLRFTGVAGTTYHIAFSFPHASDIFPGTFEFHSNAFSIQKDTLEEPVVGKGPIPLRVTHSQGLDLFSQIDVYAVSPGYSTNWVGKVTKANPVVNWSPAQSGKNLVWAVATAPTGVTETEKVAVWVGMANDNFEDAAPIRQDYPFGGEVSPNFLGATAEPNEPHPDGKSPLRSLWYKWIAPETAHTEVRLVKPYSTPTFRSSVYTGKDLQSLQTIAEAPVGSDFSDQFVLEFNAIQGVTYWLVVDLGEVPKVESATARIQLQWTPAPSAEIAVQINRDDNGWYYVTLRCPQDGMYMLEVLSDATGQWTDTRELAVVNGVAFFYPVLDPLSDSHYWFRARKL